MADRERIVEVIVDALDYLDQDDAETEANTLLVALEAAGYAWYRPEDCGPVLLMSLMTQTFIRCEREDAQYLLVPVEGEG